MALRPLWRQACAGLACDPATIVISVSRGYLIVATLDEDRRRATDGREAFCWALDAELQVGDCAIHRSNSYRSGVPMPDSSSVFGA